MNKLSLSQAAKEVGKSKPTISKAIKTGRLSANKVGNGYEIDPSELFRVYPRKSKSEPQNFTDGKPLQENQVNLLDLENKMLREQLEREKESVDDLRTRLTRAELLITDQRKGFWAKIFS